jgi:hypothetical protein
VNWELYYTKQAQKDARKLAASNLRAKAETLLDVIRDNPFQNPPPVREIGGRPEWRLLPPDQYPTPVGVSGLGR